MTDKRICSRCWSEDIVELPDSDKLLCNNCGSIFIKPESTLQDEEKCVVCHIGKRMSKNAKTCSFVCAGKLAHSSGLYGFKI